MKTKKSIWTLGMMAAACVALSGCSATLFSSSANSDDLYTTHDVNAIANADLQRREQALAQREAELRRQEEAAKAAYTVHLNRTNTSDSTKTFNSVLADNYEDAYQRRLKGFSSLSYNVNSTVPNYDQISTINYVSAYDPAVYNVMVMGDEVWVEPKYVSSLFGTWGSNSAVNLNINLGWGWSNPYWDWGWNWRWGYPYYSWYSPYWGWNSWGWNSWYWGWNHWYWDPYWYGPGYWGGGPHYWGGNHRPPRNVVYGKPGNSNYRPSTGYYPNTGSGAGYGGGGGTYRRLGSSSTITSGGTRPIGSNPTTSGGTSYRRGSSGVTINNGSSTTPSYNNNNNGTFRRSSTPTRTYNSGFSAPSGSGFGGSRGGAGGGSVGGGGGYTGGGGGYRR